MPGVFGHHAFGAQVTSHAHDDPHVMPPLQLLVPVQLTLQAAVSQWFVNGQLSGPEQLIVHVFASLQWFTAGHALAPMQSIVQGPAPHSTPK